MISVRPFASTRATVAAPPSLVDVAGGDQAVRVRQQGRHRLGLAAAGGEQAERTAHDAEQATVATDLPQQVAHPPAANLGDFLLQGFQRQRMLAVGQQVMHQQLLQERIEERRQLGEEHPEVFQHFLSRQRLAGSFRTHAATVDEIQAAGVAQQVVQVQVVLPEAVACSSPMAARASPSTACWASPSGAWTSTARQASPRLCAASR